MSTTELSAPTLAPASSQPKARVGGGMWVRVTLACLILLGSAGVRAWQVRRLEGQMAEGLIKPRIDLASVPMTLGRWKGEPTTLDPLIARATGAEQYVTRTYVNQDTGVSISVILLYGPAVDMYIHSPELCYPAAGFSLNSGPAAKLITAGDIKAPFRSLVYSKGEEAKADLQEVYFSWRYNGHWTPDVGLQKQFERIPSMYKVHLARAVTAKEWREDNNPCESLLQEILPEIERRIATTSLSPAS